MGWGSPLLRILHSPNLVGFLKKFALIGRMLSEILSQFSHRGSAAAGLLEDGRTSAIFELS